MSYIKEELNEAIGIKWTKRIIIFVSIIFLYLIFSFAFSIWPFSVVKGLATKVINSENIIYNYQWFYDQYNIILAQKANIDIIDNDSIELSGMKMVLNNTIAEYNSKSKQINRNLWKASDLPYQIKLEDLK
ncbi:MAG: hypothetical protein PHF86_14415 [Candidatus Nanoarchaeia archaeon]|jgi:hypothetical protein|nr:hypothetical protein [Candidatus Nanoarchaeia archaeon]